MNTPKNRIRKQKGQMPETIQVVISAASLLDVLRRYRKITWPVTVTVRDGSRGGVLYCLRNPKELEGFSERTQGLRVAYFRKVGGKLLLDLGANARVSVRYRSFRKARSGEFLSLTETTRYFLYRTGDLKEPGAAAPADPGRS